MSPRPASPMGPTSPSARLHSSQFRHPSGIPALSDPPSPAAAVLNLKVDERGEANHVLQQNESPLQWRLHIQLHPTASEDAQAGLSYVVAMLDLQRAQLGTVLSQDPAKKESTCKLQVRTPKCTTHTLVYSQQPSACDCATHAPSFGSSTMMV